MSATDAESTALVTVEGGGHELVMAREPTAVLDEARRAAVALTQVLDAKKRKVEFNGETYLEAEDWILLGRFYGVTGKIAETRPVEFGDVRGWEARAVALRADGMEISAADAMCLNDEEKWRARPKYVWCYVTKAGGRVEEDPGPDQIVWEPNPAKPGKNRPKKERVLMGEEAVPLFQLRSMAQTRALAKVLANVLRWIPVLAGYRGTPAEEMTPPEPPREKSAKQAKPDGISEAQGKRLKERAKAAGHTLTDVAAWLAARYDARTLGEIKRADYDAIIARLDKTAPLGSLPEDTEEPPIAAGGDADAESIPFEQWEQP